MKVGLSTYSLSPAIMSGEMSVCDAIRWIAAQGGEHVEIVPIGYDLLEHPQLVEDIRKTAEEEKLDISNYAVGANFVQESADALEREIALVKRHVDIAHVLGTARMRHDAATRPLHETGLPYFEKDLPALVRACREVADYAKGLGVTTSVENHGFYLQASERVLRLVMEVNRDNFKTTLDMGNFWCVDEDPVCGVANNLPYASIVHVKDFYRRSGSAARNPGEGWFRSSQGAYLRGAIAGQGDLDLPAVFRLLRHGGYDGYLSVEFEGMEDCRTGSRIAMDNTRRLWEEAAP